MTRAATDQAIAAVWRTEAARIIAAVARLVRDVGVAEELAQDALLAALAHWPRTGVPENPGAWLMTTARRRALDTLRQDARHVCKHEALACELAARGEHVEPDFVDALDAARQDDIGDDLLRLVFTACHPVLSAEARVALALRVLGGLSTAEIARACLVPQATVAQRIVRAKRTLAHARVPFSVPDAAEREARLASVLEVIYLIFNEGYSATAGTDWTRPPLCTEALRLGRILSGLMPQDSEVHGLLALMLIQASRLDARTDAQGNAVLLMAQDRARWDPVLIRQGLDALARAETLGGTRKPYALQAALAACHARAATAQDTDWPRIIALYDVLAHVAPSPVVALNRAVAISMAHGPQAGLDALDVLKTQEGLDGDSALAGYHWLPSVRADLLARLGRFEQARAQCLRAADLTDNAVEQRLLRDRARRLPP